MEGDHIQPGSGEEGGGQARPGDQSLQAEVGRPPELTNGQGAGHVDDTHCGCRVVSFNEEKNSWYTPRQIMNPSAFTGRSKEYLTPTFSLAWP